MKIQDIHPFGVRMPEDLKAHLAKEAKINGRSLNSEIVSRLRSSLDKRTHGHLVTEPHAPGQPALTDAERQLLTLFRKLSPEKQLALLSLFK